MGEFNCLIETRIKNLKIEIKENEDVYNWANCLRLSGAVEELQALLNYALYKDLMRSRT
jgi:hypothetical protein